MGPLLEHGLCIQDTVRQYSLLSFLPGPGLAVTCDGCVQLWDPFVMGTVREYDRGKDSRVTLCQASKPWSKGGRRHKRGVCACAGH